MTIYTIFRCARTCGKCKSEEEEEPLEPDTTEVDAGSEEEEEESVTRKVQRKFKNTL